ncbi:MAG: hypothetical protein QM493_05980 [Sulfurovum sp.]
MSKAEKIFWWSIATFFLIFIILNIMALQNSPKSKESLKIDKKEPIIKVWIEKIISSDIVVENLSKNQQNILYSLNRELNNTYTNIDKEVDNLFRPVYANVDKFLNYHYSLQGEYSELGAMAFGNIEKMIIDKLLGDSFTQNVDNTSLAIDNQYKINLQNHLSLIDKYATNGVDIDINQDALNRLKLDIDSNIQNQEIKLGVIGGAIAVKITAMIVAKITTKGLVKASSKLATKSAAASTGALIGLGCGPLAWLCSPIGAGVLWIATDEVVIVGDEYFNRDKFKAEIIKALDDNKNKIKQSYRELYQKSLQDISDKSIKEYAKISIKERKSILENINFGYNMKNQID